MKETFDELAAGIANDHITAQNTEYEFDGKKYLAVFNYDAAKEGKRPGIIVIPEWWGLNDYVKARAKLMASLGYAVLAIDVFGNGDTAHNPAEAMAFTKPYYDNGALGGKIVEAAIGKLKSYPEVDTDRIAVAGYCFGGYAAITAGVSGLNLKAAVGFHPSLGGIAPEKGSKTKILVCHGTDDAFEKNNIAPFKEKMNAAGIDYTFKDYPGAKHAFTNPGADERGKEFNIPIGYNAAADSASWDDMKTFFRKNL